MAIHVIARLAALAGICFGLCAALAGAQDAKARPRVLVFAGAPIRDVQFLRTVLARQALAKRAELTVLLQTGGKVDPVEGEKPMLTAFPDRLGTDDPDKKGMSLTNYDVIIAFDPDWTKLSTKQMELLRDWVKDGGAFLFVGGPVNSFRLSRTRELGMTAVQSLVPVVLRDNRLDGLRQPPPPYALDFTPAANDFDFLKLDDFEDGPTAGWAHFFGPIGDDFKPTRGIHTPCSVIKLRPGATLLASVGNAKQPYFVVMPFGSGKSMYLGSAETWRLREFSATYHGRFWINLTAYLAARTEEPKQKNPPKTTGGRG